MRTTVFATLLAFASPLLVTAAGCTEPDGDTATLSLPLVQVGSDGAQYRLANASFEMTASGGTTTTASGDINEPTLAVTLAPGAYSVRLVPGWTLERSTDGMTFTAVQAVLGSQNPQSVHLFPDAQSSAFFRFFVRDAGGTLTIGFGVVPDPQQIFGTLSFATATGLLAQYAGQSVDYATFFDPAQQAVETAADGSKQRRYQATGVATEFFADPIGIFAGPISQQAAGGSLTMTLRVRTDGTVELNGVSTTFTGSTISFGPATVDVALDADGFPVNQNFTASAPFTLVGASSTASGTTVVNHSVH